MGPLGDQVQRFGGDGDLLLFGDPAQVLFEGLQGDAPKVKALAAAQDGRQDPLGIGGGQHEHHPRRWLLEGLEQGIEGRGREHVALVDHIDLPARLHRGKAGAFNQFADVVDAGVRSRVDFDDIEGIAGGDGGAEFAAAARFRRGTFASDAVERARQDPGAGGFAGAPRPAEQIGRRDAVLEQCIGQGGRNCFLAHQLVKPLGPVLVVQRLVSD